MTRPLTQKMLHQFITGGTQGDAITTHAFDMQRWLQALGFVSEIYAEHIHESVAQRIRPLTSYGRGKHEDLVIYHHSLGSNVAPFLQAQKVKLLLIYHNVTPPEFFQKADPAWEQRARLGINQLQELQSQTRLALADSFFNLQDLKKAGYTASAVLPIALSEEAYDQSLQPQLSAQLQASGPNLLFLGRLAPNKKQEDLVKWLYYFKQIQPGARLYLVGDRWTVGYDTWIETLAADCGLSDAVILTGKVSQQEMVTYYKMADLYISMSAHEGFGKPLIESMYLGLPVLAYASTSVPDTMGNAGVLFHEKDYPRLAELVDILLSDKDLYQRIIIGQKKRVQAFLEANVQAQFTQFLQGLAAAEK